MIKKLLVTVAIVLVLTLSYATAKNPPTKIDFYMESLCPYCTQFATGYVKKFLATAGNEELAELNFIPYGNAKEQFDQATGAYTYVCQHGANECRGNLVESCAIKTFDKETANNFIICLEASYSGDFDKTSAKCTTEIQLDDLQHCLNSSAANEAQHEFAVQTNTLNPPHKYVPWVVVDGVPDDVISSKNIITYLCSKRSDRGEIAVCNSTLDLYTERNLGFLENLTCAREW